MTMILNCQLCGMRFYANTKHTCPTTDSRIIELLEKILDRMPEPEKTHPCPGCGTFTDKRVCNSCWGTSDDPEAGYSQAEFIEDKPAPSDDLPGEPVEPGDLRAGDRVSFPWNDEYITCNLVTVHGGSFLRSDAPDSDGFCPDVVSRGCRWAGGITDVRLIERAPREDEDSDEALARHSDDANCEWAQYRKDYGVDPTVATHKAFHAGFKAAREHIEARETYTEEGGRILMDELAATRARAEKAEAEVARVTTDLEASRASNDEWIERARRKAAERNAMTDDRDSWEQKASEAEAALADERDRHDATITERDALRKRLDAFRADVARYESEMGYVSAYTKVQLLAVKNKLVNILARERARQEGN